MTKEQLNTFHNFFNEYTNKYVNQNPKLEKNILLKKHHTHRVAHQAKLVGMHSGFKDNDLLLAETIGLFHDIGRFFQYVHFKTFSDSQSQNHAYIALEVLKEYDTLNKLSSDEQAIIFTAIEHHNAKTIPSNLTHTEEKHAKLIRDADKLDIYKIVTEHYLEKRENKTLTLDLEETPEYSSYVVEDIFNHRIADKKGLKNVNDFRLLQISWIFDINFPYTLKKIEEKNFITIIFNTLPQDKTMKQLQESVHQFLQNKSLLFNTK